MLLDPSLLWAPPKYMKCVCTHPAVLAQAPLWRRRARRRWSTRRWNPRCSWSPNTNTHTDPPPGAGITLEKAGATAVVPETLEPSLQLAAAVLSELNMTEDDVADTIKSFRKAHLADLQVGRCQYEGFFLWRSNPRVLRKPGPVPPRASAARRTWRTCRRAGVRDALACLLQPATPLFAYIYGYGPQAPHQLPHPHTAAPHPTLPHPAPPRPTQQLAESSGSSLGYGSAAPAKKEAEEGGAAGVAGNGTQEAAAPSLAG